MWEQMVESAPAVDARKSQPDLVKVASAGNCSLLLEFETGERRLLDVSSFADRGGLYDLLRNDEYLRLARVIDGGLAIGWPEGQEVYPEALFEMSVPVEA